MYIIFKIILKGINGLLVCFVWIIIIRFVNEKYIFMICRLFVI